MHAKAEIVFLLNLIPLVKLEGFPINDSPGHGLAGETIMRSSLANLFQALIFQSNQLFSSSMIYLCRIVGMTFVRFYFWGPTKW